MTKEIGIFPASGGLGGSTYRHLLRLVPNDRVTLICRYPEKVEAEYKQSGVTVQLPAIDAARRAGVKHIFYSSLGFAGDASSGSLKSDSLAVVMQAHLDSEKHLASHAKADPGFTYTSIREGLYSESFSLYLGFFDPKTASDGAEVTIPHDGSGPGVSWVKREELGEASARLIAKYCGVGQFPQQLVNGKILLSGTKELSLSETVAILGKTVGKSFKIRQISIDEYVKLPKVAEIFDETKARTWATAWEGIRAGEAALVTQDLEKLLERKPEEYEETIKAILA